MATPTSSPISPHSKPQNLAKYETPELKNMYINKHHNVRTLISAIFTLITSLVLFAFNNGPTTYRDFLLRFAFGEFSSYFTVTFGNTIAVIFLVLSIVAFSRYYVPSYVPGYEKMTNKQRELLGLPPLSGSQVIQEAITPGKKETPRTPQTYGTPTGFRSPAQPSPRALSPSSYTSPTSPFSSTDRDKGMRQRRTPLTSPMEIMDQDHLEGYMREYDETEKVKSTLSSSGALTTDSYLSPVLKYRPAFRPPPKSSPRDSDFGYTNTQAAQDVIDKLGIAEFMEDWTMRMRIWLVSFILKPLVNRFDRVEQFGLSMNQPPAPLSTQPLWQTAPSVSNPLFPSLSPTTLVPASPINDVNEAARERERLEKYMKVLGVTSREYLVQRIRELANGDIMSSFRWNGGGSYREKEWSPELGPTDSQIIIHLFCTFMDTQLPDYQNNGRPFTGTYFVVTPETPNIAKTGVVLYQRHIQPPHFQVASSSETWAVFQGRNNLFQALVLFILCCKRKFSGYLGQVLLSAKHINLLAVVSED